MNKNDIFLPREYQKDPASDEMAARIRWIRVVEEEVDRYRTLAGNDPEKYLPGLADSLYTLSTVLSACNRPDKALSAAREAVAHYRKLAHEKPREFLPLLARGLGNRATILFTLGRTYEARFFQRETVEIYRKLARRAPSAFRPDLASSLCLLGIICWSCSYQEEGLQAIEEAVKYYRKLADDDPAKFLPDLFECLVRRINMLLEFGRRKTARAAQVEMERRLFRYLLDNPQATDEQVQLLREKYLAARLVVGSAPRPDFL